ncbi:MAG: phosphodiester glycosidase family protein [Oscillospiraceae bacterium]|jgi:hypothetical protein|nr:phosphodiester glycosidase family protein [Oscillospiraceae bacterium]
MLKRVTAYFLCLAFLTAAVPAAGVGAMVMGGGHTYYRSHTYTPADLTQYTVNSLLHSGAGLAEEHILSYSPNAGLLPVTVGPDRIFNGGLTIADAAARLRSQGLDVVGGINASFYNSNMTLIGLQIRNGTLTSFDRQNHSLPAIGFTPDGGVLLGDPGISITVSSENGDVSVDQLNKLRRPDMVCMYTPDFSATTQTTQDGLHVVIRAWSRIRPGGTTTGVVSRVLRGTSAYAIADDEVVLSASTQSAIDRLAFLTEGSEISIKVGCADTRWEDVFSAASGLHYLVRNGQVTEPPSSTRSPRTAAGVRADGSVVLYTVDGRQPGYSVGLTLTELAQRMLDLGCVTAIELDGGGSTAMFARMPGEQSAKLVNKPSDGAMRRNADFILLCNVFPASDGSAAHLFPQPAYVTMMPNSTAFFSMLATDMYYRAANTPQGWVDSYADDPNIGQSNGASFTAQHPGETSLTFLSGGAVGTARVRVAGRLDSITLTDAETGLVASEVIAAPGQSVQILASGRLDNAAVLSTPRSFVWSVEGDVGDITADGVFTASMEMGKTGRIVVTGGGLTATLPVSVGADPLVIGEFSEGLGVLSAGAGGLTAKIITDINIVELGTASAALTYAFSQTAPAAQTISMSAKAPGYPSSLHLLITGDGSGHELTVSVTSVNGAVSQVSFGKLDFTGVRYLSAELPARTASISALSLIPNGSGSLNGTFYLHQIVAAWTDNLPDKPPTVLISAPHEDGSELVYTLTATDWSGGLPKEVHVKWNGETLPSPVWDAHTGQAEVRVPLPEDGLHLLSADATDALGRRSRQVSADYYGRRETSSVIWDAANKWYTGYVDYLDDRGVIDAEDIFGLRYYNPERAITRLEIIRMLYRILDLDAASHIPLPFDDISSISSYDADAVRAVYSAGLVSGKSRQDGSLYLDPNGLMTRAELFTVLNKTLPRGYERSSLSNFSDVSDIPAFALRATQTLVGMGVVSGNADGRINPNGHVLRAEVCSLFCRFFF